MRHLASAAFWRAWSIWNVSVAATVAALGYTAVHPPPAKLSSQAGSGLDGAVAIVFIAAFATVGALLPPVAGGQWPEPPGRVCREIFKIMAFGGEC